MKNTKNMTKYDKYIFEKPLPIWIERGRRRIGDGCGHTYPLSRIC